MDNFKLFNEMYMEFMEQHRPARSCVEVTGLPKGAKVEMDFITYH